MDNQSAISELFSIFNAGDIDKAEALARRIKNNFCIEDDEFIFDLDCAVYKPNYKMGKKLIADGTPELIAEKEEDREGVLNRQAVKCRIKVTERFSKHEIAGSSFTIKLDENGISSITASIVHRKDEAKEIIDCWLVRDFGQVMYW